MFQIVFSKFKEHGRDEGYKVSPADLLLTVAKNHHIPIPFECENGECGSCVVGVDEINKTSQSAHHMSERELETLISIGALTKEEADELIEKDLPSKYRLSCQCKVWTDIKVTPYE